MFELVAVLLALSAWIFHPIFYVPAAVGPVVALGWFRRWPWRRIAVPVVVLVALLWSWELARHFDWRWVLLIPMLSALAVLAWWRDARGVLVFCAVALVWTTLLFWWQIDMLVVVTLTVIGCVLLARRHVWALALIGLLSPPFAFAALGTAEYFAGTARSWGTASSDPDAPWSRGIDRVLRLRRTPPYMGCTGPPPSAYDLASVPHNAAVHGLVRWLGPMPGAYDGPYPDDSQILAALEGAESIPWNEVEPVWFRADGDRFPVDATDLEKRAGSWHAVRSMPPPLTGPRTAVFEERVEVLQLVPPHPFGDPQDKLGTILLVDRESRELFANITPPIWWRDLGS